MSILNGKISITCALLLAALTLSQSAYGGAECASLGDGCNDGGDWDHMAKLDEIGTGIYDQAQASANWPAESRKQRWNMSSGSESAREHISGSLAIPYQEIMGYDAKLYSYQNWMANEITEQRSSDAQE